MPTTSCNRYLICSSNINAVPVEPNCMIRILSACYICKSQITSKKEWQIELLQHVFILHFDMNVCIGWFGTWNCHCQPPALDVLCIMNIFVVGILEFHPFGCKEIRVVGNPPSQESVTQYYYWIQSCISYTLVQDDHLLSYVVRTMARTSPPHHRGNPRGFYLADSYKNCFSALWTIKKRLSWIHNVIIVPWTRSLWVTCPHSYKGRLGINTLLSTLYKRAEAEDSDMQSYNSRTRSCTI